MMRLDLDSGASSPPFTMKRTLLYVLTFLAVSVPIYAATIPDGEIYTPIEWDGPSHSGLPVARNQTAYVSPPSAPFTSSFPEPTEDALSPPTIVEFARSESELARRVDARQVSSQCNLGNGTGTLQCCQSTQMNPSTSNTSIPGLVGVVVDGLLGLVGLDCSPIPVIGISSGGLCSNSPLCCQKTHTQTISFGCVPVNVDI